MSPVCVAGQLERGEKPRVLAGSDLLNIFDIYCVFGRHTIFVIRLVMSALRCWDLSNKRRQR